jgi:hypothetical protein
VSAVVSALPFEAESDSVLPSRVGVLSPQAASVKRNRRGAQHFIVNRRDWVRVAAVSYTPCAGRGSRKVARFTSRMG